MISFLVLLAMSSSTLQSEGWAAFPGDGFVPEDGRGVHDPTVIEVKGKFLCFHTSGNGFGVLRSSPDLKVWKDWGPVLPETPEWLRKRIPHRSLWAPDVVKVGDTYRMYYSASERFGGNGSVIGFAENANLNPDKPLEGWVDKGLVIESVQSKDVYNAIDPEVEIDKQGRHWLFFGSYFAGLHLVELDPKTGKLKHPDKSDLVCVARNTADRGNALEAAAVCHRDGTYYLFVSYGLAAQGVRSTYRIMVGRSKDVRGPYLDAEGRSMVDGGHVLVLQSSAPMFAPGHSDVFQDSKGRWLMPYHYYDGREHWHGDIWGLPTLQIRELLWTEDGWPLPGLPVGWQGLSVRPNPKLAGRWIHQAGFGRVLEIELREDGTLVEGDRRGSWKTVGKNLQLEWPGRNDGEVFADTVQLAYGNNYYVGRNNDGLIIRGYRQATAE